MTAEQYDDIVIGAGQSGGPLSTALARAGRKVAIVVPEHLIALGGGYIGLEFGQMFRRFGSRVTIVQRGKRLLAREDAAVADAVAEILREDGIEVLLETAAASVERAADGEIKLTVRTPA